MGYEKLIYVDNRYYEDLTLYKEYKAVISNTLMIGILFIYDDNEKYLGYFPSRIFKPTDEIRKKRLKSILNEI